LKDNEFIDSKFRLVILASKRAKQILRGGKKKIDMNAENPLSVALEEIKQGKIDFEIILSEDETAIKTGEMLANEGNEMAEESISEADPEKTISDDETDIEDDGDVEAVSQVQDNQPD
jgi:DNA-directed RNA polymerase omega subunit